MADPTSLALYERAVQRLPGGVNSPVRAFKSVGGSPVFVKEAHGATLVGADGTEYVDYIGSWGPMILGHAHPEVVAAVQEAAAKGSSFGAPTEQEIDMADAIAGAQPHMAMSRLVSSGTEATMGALRLARGITGRPLIVKMAGGYHGGADYLLVKAGSGAATLGTPDSAGVPPGIAATTLTLPYNDLDAVKEAFAARGQEIAALIVEPVAGNMGCVPPNDGYLEGLRELTREHGVILIFDEVMTGFRVAYGGAAERYGVTPDLTCLGKIVGGGLPVGAYGGSREHMEHVAPAGPVYQAGTLSGNPLAVAAGLKTLEILRREGTYEKLETIAAELEGMVREAAEAAGLPFHIQRVGAMLTVFFHDGPVRAWDDADQCDREAFGRWHAALIEHGVHWAPSQFEAAFPSLAHDAAALERTRAALGPAFAAARGA
ncbi:MAG: glutamate-1-semialdehyde-2,1-aminomutase [Sandaracinus sp.]|nr:glutamate-1-semialdehyde-2,1-aminomutase [Sandaracinus sp.]|tara:strand:+ start:71 stop:1363 length:1293 start_codon:yes stop_codon:yes gene_type:complete